MGRHGKRIMPFHHDCCCFTWHLLYLCPFKALPTPTKHLASLGTCQAVAPWVDPLLMPVLLFSLFYWSSQHQNEVAIFVSHYIPAVGFISVDSGKFKGCSSATPVAPHLVSQQGCLTWLSIVQEGSQIKTQCSSQELAAVEERWPRIRQWEVFGWMFVFHPTLDLHCWCHSNHGRNHWSYQCCWIPNSNSKNHGKGCWEL